MPTAVKDTKETAVKIPFKRIGNSDYGFKLRHNGEVIDLRVTGTYVKGADPTSTVHNAWVWTARLNGKIVESKDTLRRKKDAHDLLVNELTKSGVKEFKSAPATAAVSNGSKSNTKVAQSQLKKADKTHPMFRTVPPSAETEIDPILRTTVRIKGTTLVGVVIAKTSGDRERLRIEFPEGHKAWATREVVESVTL